MQDRAAPFSASDTVIRPLAGQAAISLSTAPLALGRPFVASLLLALCLSGVVAALGRTPEAGRDLKRTVVAPTVVKHVVRRDGESDFLAALRLDAGLGPAEAERPQTDGMIAVIENAPDPNAVIQFGSRRVERRLVETLLSAARTVESDPALLMAIADKESSFSPTAKARTSSAEGLFQFIDSTWLMVVRDFGAKHGLATEAEAISVDRDGDYVVGDDATKAKILKLRRDPRLASIMAAEMLKRDSERIARRVGRSLTSGEVYLAHFLGPDDAERFIAKVVEEPGAVAAKLLPRPARANRPIFFAASARRRAKAKSLSVAEVHRKFEDMMQSRLERFRAVEQVASAATTVANVR